ncbi:hypothetical protein LB533_03390 [Mesorhizobium sp. BR1-1-13]|uniref:hypothetical protein n=1 Tax=Mesorhizobium sp. BR1-1-13 TaxID=2876656 RepID=UPI001CD14690|nr:hypothetical protein [Mesorhizobium sp. BR1-1-13]MBZ9940143.1 hypothetical protein [Mesorhizobium sp. BR1-1-13]
MADLHASWLLSKGYRPTENAQQVRNRVGIGNACEDCRQQDFDADLSWKFGKNGEVGADFRGIERGK